MKHNVTGSDTLRHALNDKPYKGHCHPVINIVA